MLSERSFQDWRGSFINNELVKIAEHQNARWKAKWNLTFFKLESALITEKYIPPTIYPGEEQFISVISRFEERRKTEEVVKTDIEAAKSSSQGHNPSYQAN